MTQRDTGQHVESAAFRPRSPRGSWQCSSVATWRASPRQHGRRATAGNTRKAESLLVRSIRAGGRLRHGPAERSGRRPVGRGRTRGNSRRECIPRAERWHDAGGQSAGSAPQAAGEYVPPAELVRRGNEAYEAGHFPDAAADYVRAEQLGVRNGPLYYNLGNAYYKSGQLGNAVASYRRAQMLSPRDPLVKANLEYVLARREDKSVQTAPCRSRWIGAPSGRSAQRVDRRRAILYTWFAFCGSLCARPRTAARRGASLDGERGTFRARDPLRRVQGLDGAGHPARRRYDLQGGRHERPGAPTHPIFAPRGPEVRIEERRPDWLRSRSATSSAAGSPHERREI